MSNLLLRGEEGGGGGLLTVVRRCVPITDLCVCVYLQDLDDIEDENEQLKQENKTLLKVVGQLTR